MYLVATGSRLGAASPHVGVMVGPRVRGLAPLAEGRWWASDNDGFTGHFQAAAFLAHLERLGPFAARCLFVAAPDMVGGVTLELEPFFPLTALQCPVEVQTLPDGCQFE